uniref:protein-glutamine gamma-glutamyltransferase n=1 Tax=Leptobrachium leishanense TaxID=445787 RepID=A0A8C5R4Y7_9ANUR
MAALKLKKFNMEESLNMGEHRTDHFHTTDLVLRRGQSFKMNLNFNRPLQKGDRVEFVASTGPDPQASDHTKAVFQLSKSKSGDSWTADPDPDSSGLEDMRVNITSPANAVIGRYKLQMQIPSNKKKAQTKLKGFVLLFNPWATDDAVYMEDENERQEYVLNDSGLTYYGVEDYINEEGWIFGQFEEDILDICLTILDKSLQYRKDPVLDCSKRNDPCYVGRVLTAMINSLDDEGVLLGGWSGDFEDGVHPLDWIGSVDILRAWKKQGYKPVKYGQCWVFAGVLCTVLRALGFPTRLITNFASAHDKEGNLSIDTIYTSKGKNISEDSMWNFHCWNESWFTRPDLGEDFGGWQVLDSTPQEISSGLYCCGPTSVHAIKEGDVDLDYDGPFVFSEVNADRCTWVYYDKDVKEKVYTDSKTVGQNISTKAVGSDDRVDITENYKYAEGTDKERAVYQKATEKLAEMGKLKKKPIGRRGKRSPKKRKNDSSDMDELNYEEPSKPVISGKFKLDAEPKFKEDINLTLILNNSSKESETVKIKLSSSSIEYTGKPRNEIYKDEASCTVEPSKETKISINIPAANYKDKLTKDHLIEVVALCELKTKKKILIRKVVVIGKPPIRITVFGFAMVDEPFELDISFTNPLSAPLTDGVLVLGGSGLIKKTIKKRIPKLDAKETGKIAFEITPYRSGAKQLVVDLISKKFPPIKARRMINVGDGTEEEMEMGENAIMLE